MANEMIEDWNKWKNTLHRAVAVGDLLHLSTETKDKIAEKVGDFLANNVDPENREQRLIKELWTAATDEEQKILAHLILKLVSNE